MKKTYTVLNNGFLFSLEFMGLSGFSESPLYVEKKWIIKDVHDLILTLFLQRPLYKKMTKVIYKIVLFSLPCNS